MSTFNPGDFVKALNQIASSEILQDQLKGMIDQKSASIKVASPNGEIERKIRFYSKEFSDALSELSKNASDQHSTNLKPLIELMVGQIEKEQVIFKEKINGKATYHASKDIIDRIRNGEFTIRTKSGEKTLAIEGETSLQETTGQVKSLNIQEFATGSVSSIAEQLKHTFLQVLAALANEEPVSKKPEKPEESSTSTSVLEHKAEETKEASSEQTTSSKDTTSHTPGGTVEKRKEKRNIEEDQSQEFYENEKLKDEEWTEKHDMIVKKEEMKKQLEKEENIE